MVMSNVWWIADAQVKSAVANVKRILVQDRGIRRQLRTSVTARVAFDTQIFSEMSPILSEARVARTEIDHSPKLPTFSFATSERPKQRNHVVRGSNLATLKVFVFHV